MIEDRLYRLTIPGTVFIALLVGWLIVDPTIDFLGVLKDLKIEGTAPLSVIVLGGGVILVFMGYICGEVGLAFGIPEPALAKDSSKQLTKVSFVWGLAIFGSYAGASLLLHTVGYEGLLWIATTLATFGLVYSLKYIGRLPGVEPYALPKESWDVLRSRLGKEVEDTDNSLAVISLYTHGVLAPKTETLTAYLSRAWGRMVIGTYSCVALLLAVAAYCGLKAYVHLAGRGEWRLLWTIEAALSRGELLYIAFNMLLLVVLIIAVHKQSIHRSKLYALLLKLPEEFFDDKK